MKGLGDPVPPNLVQRPRLWRMGRINRTKSYGRWLAKVRLAVFRQRKIAKLKARIAYIEGRIKAIESMTRHERVLRFPPV